MQGINFKAVILGTAAMFALDIVIGIVLFGIYSEGLTPEMTDQEMEAVVAGLIKNGAYLFWGAVLGTLTTVVGGYVAARTARMLPYKNAFAFGVLGIVICLFMGGDLPFWYNALGIGIALPAALFGAHIAKRQINNRVD
jgi:hypothetical protein